MYTSAIRRLLAINITDRLRRTSRVIQISELIDRGVSDMTKLWQILFFESAKGIHMR